MGPKSKYGIVEQEHQNLLYCFIANQYSEAISLPGTVVVVLVVEVVVVVVVVVVVEVVVVVVASN